MTTPLLTTSFHEEAPSALFSHSAGIVDRRRAGDETAVDVAAEASVER